jgi:DNA-binding winged helix-turn-helix (wHTH) protein
VILCFNGRGSLECEQVGQPYGGFTPQRDVGSKKRFGVFEFDPEVRELKKHDLRLKVQDQPIQILAALLDKPGQIVPREELQRRLWPDGTFVDFEQSLNKAVNKLREALGDSAAHPIYIETLSRRGYRFVAPVEAVTAPIESSVVADEPSVAGVPNPWTVKPASRRSRLSRRVMVCAAVGVLLSVIVLTTGLWSTDVPHVKRVVPLTNDATHKLGIGRLISDGNRVMYSGGSDVWSVAVSGGEPARLSLPFLRNPGIKVLADYSSIRQQILLASPFTGTAGSNEIWLAGTDGGAPHKIAELRPPVRGALAPEADRIVVSTPDGIYIQSLKNGDRKKIHSMSGMSPTLPWWHPSGHKVGFLDLPDDPQKARAWQVDDDGTQLQRIVPETEQGQGPGAWSQDGRRFFYVGGEGEVFVRVEAGMLGWLGNAVVTRLTASGQFRDPPAVDPVDPRRLYAVGSVLRGETMRYDRKARRWVPFLNGFSGVQIEDSPDSQWRAYITYPESELHRCKIDGSSDVLLARGVEALNPSWSPNGKQIAFSGRPAGTSAKLKLWLVSAEGGDAAPYSAQIESGGDTTWSGDGERILLGQDESARSRIRIIHLKTGELESIPGTEKLFSPRWSAGERQMVALEVNTLKLFIFEPASGGWLPLGEQAIGYPKWSRDSKYIYGAAGSQLAPEAVRIEVATGRREVIARPDFKMIENGNSWLGWTREWEPLVVRDLSSTQVYRIDLDR